VNRREYLLSTVSAATLLSASRALAKLPEKEGDSEADLDVQIRYGVKIPMRDGVFLDATLYLPKNLPKPRPAIFSLTPYSADREYPEGLWLAQHGLPTLAIDVRGRGNSGGEFAPFFNDPNDGHDIVEWIAKQPYCNGKVGARGISYVGFTQWAAVRGNPEHLATIVPSAPCWVGLDYPLRHNIFYTFLAPWLIFTRGKANQLSVMADETNWAKTQVKFLQSGMPFKEMDAFFGFESKPFREWMQHPHQEEYYDRANPTPEQLANLKIPVLSLTGMYDGDQPGTLEFHRQHLKHGGGNAQHYLVIGPWDHPRVRNPAAEFLGLKVGPDSVVDMKKLHRDWYAWTMEDGAKPDLLKKKVAYYVMVADKWRYADTLEEVTARHETLYLQSTVNPKDVFASGALSSAPSAARAKPDTYVYDPRDLKYPMLESTLTSAYYNLSDQLLVLSSAGSKLIYHSAPFERDTEVSGFFKFTAWIAIDQPDTDFNVSIYDIGPDGSSVYLTEQNFRARYREGLRIEKLINTKEPLRYDFDRFFFVSRRIATDHRLRLVVRPNHTIKWQKNYNSGKPVAEETMADARTVTVTLFHDQKYPSVLNVPMGQPET
jgi:putative CocE/NonD family hydrolase